MTGLILEGVGLFAFGVLAGRRIFRTGPTNVDGQWVGPARTPTVMREPDPDIWIQTERGT